MPKACPLLALPLFALLLFLSSPADAHPSETWGLTSNAAAQGNAMSAICSPVEAVFYNVARALPGPDSEIELGFTFADDALKISEEDAGISPHTLIWAGLSSRLPLSDWLADRLGISLAVVLPGNAIYSVQQPDDATPTLPFWDGRNRRLVLSGAIALQPLEWLSVGVGATLLPDVTGEVSVDLADDSGKNATQVVVDYNIAPSLGLNLHPFDGVDVALTWKGAHTTELLMPVDVEVAKGVAPVRALVTSPAYSQPDQITLGAAFSTLPGLRGSFDATWFDYSAFKYSSPDVKVLGDDEEDILQESLKEPILFRDAWTLRFGLEWQILERLALRAGYRYAETPVPLKPA